MSSNFMQCSLCKNLYVQPKILPRCLHTFCLKCLEKYGSERGSTDRLPCPECKAEFDVPAGVFASLPDNLFVERLIRIVTLSEPARSTCPQCDVCILEGKSIPSKAFCVECTEFLCERCAGEHRRPRPCRSHEIIEIGVLGEEDLQEKFSSDFCEVHPAIRLDRLCDACDVLICKVCFAEHHISHECSELGAVKEGRVNAIEEQIQTLDRCLQDYAAKKTQLEKTEAEFSDSVTDIEKEVLTRCQELKDLIDRRAEKLLENIKSVHNEGLQQANSREKEISDGVESVTYLKDYCRSLCNKGSARDICSADKLIRERVRSLQEQHDVITHRELSFPTMALQKSNFDDVYNSPSNSHNVVGNIKVCRPPQTNFVTTKVFQGYSVMGLATLNDKMFVLCHYPQTVLDELNQSNVIKVFSNQQPFAFIKDIVLNQMASVFDLAACQTEGCLYVTDMRQVYKIRFEGRSEEPRVSRFISWEYSPHTMFVTSEGNVLLPRDGPTCVLEMYDTNARLISRTMLVPEIASVIHAVSELSDGNFLAIVRWKDADVTTTRVLTGQFGALESRGLCEISITGDIVKRFTAPKYSQQLDNPQHLALYKSPNAPSRGVFVADHGKDCVPLFDSKLRFLSFNRLQSICGPKRIFFDADNNRLLVGHFKQTLDESIEGIVDIYEIERIQ